MTEQMIYDELFIEKHQTKRMTEKHLSQIPVPRHI